MQAEGFRVVVGSRLLLAVPAHADGVMQRAQARGSLVVAAAPFPEQLPQSARDESRGYSGFDVDVANEIGKRLGLPVRFVSPGWTRARRRLARRVGLCRRLDHADAGARTKAGIPGSLSLRCRGARCSEEQHLDRAAKRRLRQDDRCPPGDHVRGLSAAQSGLVQ